MDKSKLEILVVDDDPFILKMLARMLAAQGIERVSTFEGGDSALAALGDRSVVPDVILLDLNMPNMDGIEFLRHLAGCGYVGALVLISGENVRVLQSAARLVHAHHLTMLGYLHKPVRPAELSALLDNWTPCLTHDVSGSEKRYDAEDLRSGLDRGEIINHYQPKVMVATGEVKGAEALVRWRHSRDGLVFPDRFIGVAEAHGLIDDLTRVVLVNALTQLKEWQDAGLVLQLAVNISMDNLTSVDFVDFVVKQVEAMNVNPSDLVLEVTETQVMQDERAPLDVLTRLRLKGFGISIDDFGTGHSSLALLRNIPFTELKIDRGFVHRAWADQTARALYHASLGLARKLGMQSVAEGVEDARDWNFLFQTKCDVAQGYFISKPLPPGDFLAWVHSWCETDRRGLIAND